MSQESSLDKQVVEGNTTALRASPQPQAPGIRSLGWCFTANIPQYWERPEGVFEDLIQEAEYMVCQIEKAPTTGQLHIQGYIWFQSARTLQSVKNKIKEWCGIEAHLEKARGSPQQNKDYCTKEESRVDGPWEMGSPSAAFDWLKWVIELELRSIVNSITQAGQED